MRTARYSERPWQRRWFAAIATLISLFLLGTLAVSAQAAIPITIGENKTGTVGADGAPVQYSVQVATPQSINVQVLAITPGFFPTMRVIDPSGIVVLDAANNGAQTISQGAPNLSSPGTYTIEIGSVNGVEGQFLISVQPGAPLALPQSLTPGTPINGSVDRQNSRQAYSFTGSASDVLLLSVRSTVPTSGPVITLRDADTDETLGLSSARLSGIAYRIPLGSGNFLVEVMHSGANTPEGFDICLANESGSATCPGGTGGAQQVIQATATLLIVPTLPPPTFAPVAINPTGPCQVASARGQTINVRNGPGTNYAIVGNLSPTGTGIVLGRLADNTWFQVNVNGILGWVSSTVVILGGNCNGVPVVTLPTPIPPLATSEVSPFTATPSSTPTATNTPGGSVIDPPILNVTLAVLDPNILITPRLDYTAAPNYGEANLNPGFSPDPYSVGMTSGGDVDVSYLGSSCSGFATAAPDFRVNYGGGSASLLRFYFVSGSGDTTLVVNDPFGNFYCVDDSFGTVNPTVDFNNPAGGTYDVWVGSYADETFVSGTFYATELSANHP